jgi:signal transduction histidine kinase
VGDRIDEKLLQIQLTLTIIFSDYEKLFEEVSMTPERRVDELIALKEIAETLNKLNDMHQMLQVVLRKVLEVTGLKTGWIFLLDEEPEYTCVADENLPPALSWGEKTPMCSGTCWCVDKYWGKRLHKAVNIINCKRIEDAIEYKWGDTAGIYHHATVPLKAGDEWFGLLNVASPDKVHFTDEELALLESFAYQIGSAIKRTKLYHAQQKRAEMYTILGEIAKHLGACTELNKIPSVAVKLLGTNFPWTSVAFFMQEGDKLSLRALYKEEKVSAEWRAISFADAGKIGGVIRRGEKTILTEADQHSLHAFDLPPFRSAVAMPIKQRAHFPGVLLVTSDRKNGFDENDMEILQALTEHIANTLENARLVQQRRELTKLEERNRLARDLHDSVSQNLFSLTLMTKGLAALIGDNNDLVAKSLQEMERLTEESLKEMRSLIWQLRPAGLEQGLLTALKQYGEKLGLSVHDKLQGVCELPRATEETLWRIGQEALNNVSKHAGATEVKLFLKVTALEVSLEIADNGCGFRIGENNKPESIGLLSMRERAEMLGGILTIDSTLGKGTRVRVTLPK